ncbi:hypothetical protein HYH03_003048 [Edaphochlamys debaryana]|uniref:Uncharacterized protein n=1 Tax=Edaphochlamys debaryana TaxID=47281 RepID=A0A835YA65_9CHLO|nr:hypothetical protein HYH03_003048 [Edaphochlamys debaryana]|eukprot:KAG2498856.1 hypothetical protein HYH03_003048 [Edaphochlamys debaryana]
MPSPSANPSADLANVFGGNAVEDVRDPITPFTLYGTTYKKYLIEQLDGEKIVSRKKGFTATTCIGAVEVTKETPQFQMLTTPDKALYAKEPICRKAEGQDLKETCRMACESACNDTVNDYAKAIKDESGFAFLAKDESRLAKNCIRSCSYECAKPGKSGLDFIIPYRK